MKILNWLFPVLLIFVSSCETFFELEIPESAPRLVINALLEPSSPIFVHVSSSNSILEENEFEIVNDAVVTISDEGGKIQTLEFVELEDYMPNYGYYSTETFDLVPGSTYTIETSKTGFETATSLTKIPGQPKIKSFSYELLPFEEGIDLNNKYPEMEFTLVFDDPGGENYYEIDLYFEGSRVEYDQEGNPYETIYRQFAYLDSKNPAYDQDYHIEPGLVINDLLFDQQEASIDFQTYIPPRLDMKVKVYLREITEESYRYGTSVSLQKGNRGDPLSQPVQVFSNIKNGFGILRARNSTYLEDSIFMAK